VPLRLGVGDGISLGVHGRAARSLMILRSWET
jgi:hypothetical protein